MRIPEGASKREYKQYVRSLKSIITEENKKPEASRDEELIKECGETISYCEQRLFEIGSRSKGSRMGKPVKIALIAAIVAAVLASSIVSLAYGRPLLFGSLYWDVEHSTANDDGSPRFTETIPRRSGEIHEFKSEEELRAFFGDDLLLPGFLNGVYFVSATSEGDKDSAYIKCEYRVNKKPMLLAIDRISNVPEGVVVTENRVLTDDEYAMAYRFGIIVGEGSECSYARFDSGFTSYLFVGEQGADIIEDIAVRTKWSGK